MTSLEALARRCGVALMNADGRGRDRPIPRATLQSILAALGVECDTDDRAAASLAAIERLADEPLLAAAAAAFGAARGRAAQPVA